MVEKSWTIAPTVFDLQKDDLNDIFSEYIDVMSSYVDKPHKKDDLVGCAIYGWKLMHIAVDHYRNRYPNWIIIRHEDMSVDPFLASEELYTQLRLNFTPKVEQVLIDSTTGNSVTGRNRDSKENLLKWKYRLDANTIKRIREETYPVSERFYADSDW
jgi:hypothetical protein